MRGDQQEQINREDVSAKAQPARRVAPLRHPTNMTISNSEEDVMKATLALFAGTFVSAIALTGAAHAEGADQQQGQEQHAPQVTTAQARQFMQRTQNDLNQILQSGDASKLRQWTQNNVFDHAVFAGTRQFNARGQSGAYASTILTKPALMHLEHAAFGAMTELLENSRNTNLNIHVQNVWPVGNSAVMVRSQITETKTIGGHGGGRQQMSMDERAPYSDQQDDSDNGQQAMSDAHDTGGQQYTTGAQGREEYDESADEQGSPRNQRGGRMAMNGQQGGLQIQTQGYCTHVLDRNPDNGRIQIVMGICDASTSLAH
jgi:hypothetical protein